MSSSRKRARNPHGEGSRLREELIEAAGRVLARSSLSADLSLRAVAREAGVAAPSVYLQFEDKAELMRAVRAANFDRLRQSTEQAISPISDPAARLRAGCLAYCQFGLEHPGAYRVLFEYEAPDDHYLGVFGTRDDAGARAFGGLVDSVTACMTAGVAPAGDPFRTATLLWSAMHGYLTLVRLRRGFPWPPVDDHVEDLVVSIVGVPRWRPHICSDPQSGGEDHD